MVYCNSDQQSPLSAQSYFSVGRFLHQDERGHSTDGLRTPRRVCDATALHSEYSYNPEGIRIGQNESRNRRAVKVWERREFRNLDDSVELGMRNIKLALRRFAREGAADLFGLDGTIDATARNAGLLDKKMVPERHNAIKVLLFLDVGGFMDDHVRIC